MSSVADHLFKRLAPRGEGRMNSNLIRFAVWNPPVATWYDALYGAIDLTLLDPYDDDGVGFGPKTTIRASRAGPTEDDDAQWQLRIMRGGVFPHVWLYRGRLRAMAYTQPTGCPTCGCDMIAVHGFFEGTRRRGDGPDSWEKPPRPVRDTRAECARCRTPVPVTPADEAEMK